MDVVILSDQSQYLMLVPISLTAQTGNPVTYDANGPAGM